MRPAADGDQVAFAGLVDAHHADMSSVCFVVTGGDIELTEEAVQSAWPIAWRKLHTIRDPERLRPWLISIAVNEARQLARRRRRGRVLEIVAARDPRWPARCLQLQDAAVGHELQRAPARLQPISRT